MASGPADVSGSAAREHRRGLIYALVAYVLWGFFPLYFSWVSDASALEIVAHRVVWCFGFLLIVLAFRRDWSWVRPLLRSRRRVTTTVAACAVIVANWLTYNWAVNTEQAVEGSLGYFIAPLVTVLIGVVVLKERLRVAQWAAVAIAAVAVTVMTVETGRLPWIALVLAVTFATYGALMKFVDTPPVEAITVGMGALVLPFVVVLLVLQARGELALFDDSPRLSVLLIGAGLVTAVPMVFFTAAAPRVPLSTMGILQYVNPVLQFLLSVLVLRESLTTGRWIGFALVWVALAVFAADGWRQSRQRYPADWAEAEELARP